jgi:hypothetical protein
VAKNPKASFEGFELARDSRIATAQFAANVSKEQAGKVLKFFGNDESTGPL